MAKINVAKPFLFTHKGGKKQHFGTGVHKDVPDEVAEHWFVKAHLHPADDDVEAQPEDDPKKSGGNGNRGGNKPPEGNKK